MSQSVDIAHKYRQKSYQTPEHFGEEALGDGNVDGT